jgi:hypothetical protein
MKAAHIRDGKIINTIVVGEGYTPPAGTTIMPYVEAIAAGIPFAAREPDSRKIWPDKSKFWDEFTADEKAAILTSEHSGIKVLWSDLTMWPGEVWSDDSRIQQGLSGLAAVGILTESRKTEITTK